MTAGLVLVEETTAVAYTDEDMLELLVREHARLVYRIAYSVLRHHQDAEDATQETFVRVLRYGKQLAGIDNPRAWLARIAWRVAIERRKKSPEIPLEDLSEVVADLCSKLTAADESMLGHEMSELLGGLIQRLPPKLRGPITLATIEEVSTADIAQVLGINEAAVRSRLFRARAVLKEKLLAILEGKL